MHALPLRLAPGDDLRRAIEAAATTWPGGSGFVLSGIGSLGDANIRYAAAEAGTVLAGPLEILTLSGSVTRQGAHLHAAVATASGQVLGGHVGYGCIVRTTAEVLLATLPGWQLTREHDDTTGYPELRVAIRPPTDGG